jgi:hypothetical protein
VTYLVGTGLNGKTALISTLVSCILAVVHLGITAPLPSVRDGIEVVSASYVLDSGYISACFSKRSVELTFGDGRSGDSTSCTFVSLEISSGGGSSGRGGWLG